MDILFKSMELAERHYPSGLRVENIGYLPRKFEWVSRSFDCYNYSLILEGKGRYEAPGISVEITAPFVITQAPGTKQSYGPDSSGWSEIYLIYDKLRLPELTARKLWPLPAPLWSVQSKELFLNSAQFLISRLKEAHSLEQADYLDRLAENCILTSLLTDQHVDHKNPIALKLANILSIAKTNLGNPVDWSALADSEGLSLSTFRRHWLKRIGIPPATYLTNKRMEEAARLLITTQLPIKAIAIHVGYEDPLHFSRAFRKHFNRSPRNYRNERHRA
ncbi:MAG: helix-turn-helix domain-containing protein [Opitutaceae bacterium]